MQLLTIEHMAVFVLKSVVIQINDQVYGSINRMATGSGKPGTYKQKEGKMLVRELSFRGSYW